MSGDTKVLDQNPVVPVAGNIVSPAGSIHKEQAPIGSGLPELRPAGPEVKHTISEELMDIGVEEKHDRPILTDEHKGLVHHAGPHVPVPSVSSGKVILPMSEEEIASKLRTGQDDDSSKWQAGLLKKIMKAIGF